MKNKIIKKLIYTIVADKEGYKNAKKLEFSLPGFKFSLDNFIMEVELNKQYATEEEAREEVDSILKTWESYIDLNYDRNEMKFKYNYAEMIEMEEENDETKRIISVSSTAMVTMAVELKIITPRDQYLAPPSNFILSPDVCSLLQRFNNSLEGKEPLLSMVYYCKTLVENKGGGTRQASQIFKINGEIFKKIGELSSIRGDFNEARKINGNSRLSNLQPNERQWLIAALKKIIIRIGEYDYDPNASFAMINMNHLPKL